MSKNTQEDKENLKEKLSYLGLNLERIPKVLKEFESFSFKPAKSYDDTRYKVYQYIPVSDIQILLTPTDRLTSLNQKYKLSAPIAAYLDSKSQENVEKFATFLKMINDVSIEEIEDLEKEQENLKKKIPYEVKYPNNYIWQIYYSDISNKYFMLVPTNESNNSSLFYLIKKQIEAAKTRKKEYIFAPITHQEYSGKFLVQSQITDLENYLWYFTKDWPNIFEVYDIKGKMSLKIVGTTKVYREVNSDYVVTFETKEQANEWYKLVKALFILSTGLSDYYSFRASITDNGSLGFWNKQNEKIEYENLPLFIRNEVEKTKLLVGLENKKLIDEQEKLEELKKITQNQTEEFLNKERQIATFLACKKSFFGKIKYYFGNRNKVLGSVESHKLKATKQVKKKEEKKPAEIVQEEPKENYTLEDLIEICTKLNERARMVKNLEMDTKAQELKKINLERKIKNANIYLNEIELHKKSIFEFWKFSNKDELPSLNEGEEQENTEKEKLGKSFNYEEDIEDLGKQMDELQRRKLSKNEEDSIFAIKEALNTCKILAKTKSTELNKKELKEIEDELNKLKKEYEENIETIQIKDFDIFGGISDDNTKVKMLNNQKHREVEKNKYNILNITPNTDLDVYIDNLRNYLRLAKEAFHKISTPFEIPVYIANIEDNEQNSNNDVNKNESKNIKDINEKDEKGKIIKELDKTNLEIANLNATEELYNKIKQTKDNEIINFYTLHIPQASSLLYYTNIIYFDNLNQTLPIGMDVSKDVLINLKYYRFTKKCENEFNVNYKVDEYTNKVIKVNSIEYDLEYKK